MIPTLLIGLAGIVAVVLQSAVAAHVPRFFVPDVAPLFALSLALHVGGARGLATALAIGLAADALSVTPTGQLMLVQALAYAVSRIAHASLELRTPIAQASLAAIASPIGVIVCALLAPANGYALIPDMRIVLQIGAQFVLAAVCMPTISAGVSMAARPGSEAPVMARAVPPVSSRRVG